MSDPSLPGFELIEKIGQGGMGAVWKARQVSLDRIVAIKFLSPQLSRNPENVQAIMKEARIAAKLKHPGIVQVYDAGADGDQCYFVMEYVDGYNVGEWLRRKRLIGSREALLVAEHVAVALDYAWQTSGIIHCDIKPENIMVDSDGIIKVADLGLSRIVGTAEEGATEVMGTPSFMSPEQVTGDVALDCRTDIYSLGATLYNMLTGHRLFHGIADGEVMEQQITGTVDDPRQIVPNLSYGVCRLLEMMLSKDRDLRPSNWITVLNDIRRLQKGLPPAGKAVSPGASTVRIENRDAAPASKSVPEAAASTSRSLKWFGAVVIVAAMACVGWYGWQKYGPRKPPDDRGTPPPGGSGISRPGGPADVPGGNASEAYSAVQRWMGANPEDTEEAVRRLQGIVGLYPGSAEAQWALGDLRRLREAASSGGDIWLNIRSNAEALRAKGQTEEAVRFLEMYTGRGAVATASNRMSLAREMRSEMAAGQLAKLSDRKWLAFLQSLADEIIAGQVASARDALQVAVDSGSFEAQRADAAAIDTLLGGMSKADTRIIESFRGEVGKVVNLRVGRGVLPIKVLGVEDGKLRGFAVEEKTEIIFGAAQLAPTERLARMGDTDASELALARGVLLVQSRLLHDAIACFESIGEPLGPILAQRLRAAAGSDPGESGEASLRGVLKDAGIVVGPYADETWVAAVKAARLDKAAAAKLNAAREGYLVKFGTTEFGAKAAPVLLEMERVCEEAREGRHAPPPVAPVVSDPTPPPPDGAAVPESPPPDLDPMTVALALVSVNPEITPEMVSITVTQGLTELRISSPHVKDLAPVVRLTGIGSLALEAPEPPAIPIDLRPLRGTTLASLRLKNYVPKDVAALSGMKLKTLVMPDVSLLNYAPLEGLPLVTLDLSGSNVKDLGFVRGMRLQVARLDNTKITSIASLAGMPLRVLSLANTGVRDLSVLRGRSLDYLNVSSTPLFDLQSLLGCTVRELVLRKTQVRDLSSCAKLKVEDLDLAETAVQDLSPLRGLKLNRLILRKAPMRDLETLRGMSICRLDVSGVKVPLRSMYEALKGVVGMESLDVSETEVGQLDFLAGSKVRDLNIAKTRVKNLSPLAGLSIRSLDCRGCAIEDYAELKKLPIEKVWCDVDVNKYKDFFRTIPTLKYVNDHPVGDR